MKIQNKSIFIILVITLLLGGCSKFVQTAEKPDDGRREALVQEQKEVIGKYVGQIDNNSIEVILESELQANYTSKNVAFRLSEEVRPEFELNSSKYLNLQRNQKVKMLVVRIDNNQWMVLTISKMGEDIFEPRNVIETTGNYVGRIDNSSIEVIVDGKPQVFRLNDEISKYLDSLSIESNKKIHFTYFKNNYHQFILTNLKLTN